MPDVLLATCEHLPAGDEDGAALLAALAQHGADARWAAWTDTSVDWTAAPVVLRSTWDYTMHRDRFLAWVGAVPHVHNSADVVRWNSDKLYLADLAASGVPITPTTFACPGDPVELPHSGEIVVKPSVGAGSRGAGRFTPDRYADALEHAAHLHAAGRTVLVQPYFADVESHGETALVYVDGVFSHAVRKGPLLGAVGAHPLDESAGLYVEENITHRDPGHAELAVGAVAVAALRERFGEAPLYARVDLLPSAGGPVVVELELTEPSLFLNYGEDDAPARRLATAIAGHL